MITRDNLTGHRVMTLKYMLFIYLVTLQRNPCVHSQGMQHEYMLNQAHMLRTTLHSWRGCSICVSISVYLFSPVMHMHIMHNTCSSPEAYLRQTLQNDM